jgi:excisionase family DNA binding protein
MFDLMNLPEKVKLEISKADLMEFANHLLTNRESPKMLEEEFISIQEVGKVTGLARQTIYGRVSKGTIPYYKAEDGKRLRFKKSEILNWMSSGKKNTEADILKGVDDYFINKTKKLSIQKNR